MNLRTCRYSELDADQRANAIALAYEDGYSEMENDLAADGVTISEYETFAASRMPAVYLRRVIEPIALSDPDVSGDDWLAWRQIIAAGHNDPRLDAFIRGWRDREHELRADAVSA